MKNRREFFIACIFFLSGVATTYLFFQNHIAINKKIVQPQELLFEQSNLESNTLSPDLKTAIELIEQKGYTVIETSENWYSSSQPLNAIIGTCNGAEGYCKQAFFFYNGKYLGTDTSDPSSQISILWRNSDTIALNYVLYRKDDPTCCPTAGAVTVRFQWDGNKLVALDSIPPLGLSADGHR